MISFEGTPDAAGKRPSLPYPVIRKRVRRDRRSASHNPANSSGLSGIGTTTRMMPCVVILRLSLTGKGWNRERIELHRKREALRRNAQVARLHFASALSVRRAGSERRRVARDSDRAGQEGHQGTRPSRAPCEHDALVLSDDVGRHECTVDHETRNGRILERRRALDHALGRSCNANLDSLCPNIAAPRWPSECSLEWLGRRKLYAYMAPNVTTVLQIDTQTLLIARLAPQRGSLFRCTTTEPGRQATPRRGAGEMTPQRRLTFVYYE